MILFIQYVVIFLTLLIWLKSAKENKIPQGLIEWILTIATIAILISGIYK